MASFFISQWLPSSTYKRFLIHSSFESFSHNLFKLEFETFIGDKSRSLATSIGVKTMNEEMLDNFLGTDFIVFGSISDAFLSFFVPEFILD